MFKFIKNHIAEWKEFSKTVRLMVASIKKDATKETKKELDFRIKGILENKFGPKAQSTKSSSETKVNKSKWNQELAMWMWREGQKGKNDA